VFLLQSCLSGGEKREFPFPNFTYQGDLIQPIETAIFGRQLIPAFLNSRR